MSAVRHRASTKTRSIELRQAGWSLSRIRALLEREGVRPVPSPNTIWCWVNEPAAMRQNAHKRVRDQARRISRSEFRWPGVRSAAWKLARMRRLDEAGVSMAAIATVMSIDFPDTPLTRSQVEGALRDGRMPRTFKAVA